MNTWHYARLSVYQNNPIYLSTTDGSVPNTLLQEFRRLDPRFEMETDADFEKCGGARATFTFRERFLKGSIGFFGAIKALGALGWEPFANDGHGIHFRRRVES